MKLTSRVKLLSQKYLVVQYRSPKALPLIWYTSQKNPRNEDGSTKFAHPIYNDLAIKPPKRDER